jgi:hypothetical protein
MFTDSIVTKKKIDEMNVQSEGRPSNVKPIMPPFGHNSLKQLYFQEGPSAGKISV